ncbi:MULTISPECIES: hypothetical protein [unclassified Sphingomonas]|uniref:hypothetical protein n=1 Tax=unclassified Sphingomonas TaxID=196159 RepID=UPI002269F8C6|nr:MULTISPECIES: hypothetical protein [unclassified Sphingomonas]
MSAVSVIVQSCSVSLLTDGALCAHDGTLRAIASKVAINQRLRMAIVGIGRIRPNEIAAKIPVRSQNEAIRSLPAFLAMHRQWNAENAADYERAGRNDCHLIVGLWSDDEDAPEAWIVGSSQAFFGPSYRPFTLAQIDQLCMPPIAAGAFDPAVFDPRASGAAVLSEQRKHLNRGKHWVGGFGELTTVTAEGVNFDRLLGWSDKVGEAITP